MIRAVVAACILLIAPAVPAFAEMISLQCKDIGNAPGEGIGTPQTSIIIIFNTDTLMVTDQDNNTSPGTYPMQMTDAYVKWQSQEPSKTFSATYDRNSARLTVSGTFYNVYNCVRMQKPF